jgi:hypothetical protein
MKTMARANVLAALAAAIVLLAPASLLAQGVATNAVVPVTVQEFQRAETDNVLAVRSAKGCFGKFCIEPGAAPIDGQTVPRMNRGTPST